jgi:hypothetical protein
VSDVNEMQGGSTSTPDDAVACPPTADPPIISLVPEETQHVPDGPLPAAAASSTSASVSPSSPAGTSPRFGRFVTSDVLGSGAMGTVYRAHDERLGRDVAIKTLTSSGELGVRERFLREARAIGAVHHSNILAVHDVGEEDSTPYLVMELAAGGSLRERVKAGPLDPAIVRDVGVQIARALGAAHAAGIVHRDVKPANILCMSPRDVSSSGTQPATWKLADFGIAHVPDSTLTMTGQFLGSPSYAAPESLRAGQFGPASDVYSLGATLYEALAGSPPHGDHDMQSIIRKLEQEPTPLAMRVPAAPRSLADAIMAALARDPAQRPTADALARMLADDGAQVVPVPPPVVAAGAGGATTSSPLGKFLALGLLAIAVTAIVLALRGDKPTPAASIKPVGDEPSHEAPTEDQPTPTIVDQYGNPVDEETARQILEQMQQDAAESGPGRGHGRGKKKHKPPPDERGPEGGE